MQHFGRLQWHKLSKIVLRQRCSRLGDILYHRSFMAIKRGFLQDNILHRQSASYSKLLSLCRPSLSLDSLIWLFLSYSEHSRCVRWKLGCLYGGQPKPCPKHNDRSFTKNHDIQCLNMHRKL
jgi:hypothetical protein